MKGDSLSSASVFTESSAEDDNGNGSRGVLYGHPGAQWASRPHSQDDNSLGLIPNIIRGGGGREVRPSRLSKLDYFAPTDPAFDFSPDSNV